MTYKEAKEVIDQNTQKILGISATREPAREIMGFFIAPILIFSDNELREYFIQKCIRENTGSDKALNDLPGNTFFSDKLEPFIVIRMGGRELTLLLQHYLHSDSVGGNENDDGSGNA